MEHAKKMILIEPRVLESMQQQQQQTRQDYDTTSRDLKETDQSMQAILDSSDGHIQDKANAFQQALRGFLNRFDEYKNRPLGRVQLTPPEQSTLDQDRQPSPSSFPPPPLTQETDAVEQDVMISVPANLKKRAARILQRLKADPEVKWNDRGEFEYRGRLIKNSNLTDLVNDVLKKRNSVKDPRGWETFAQALQRLNVPQDLIGNNSRWSYMRKQDDLNESLAPSTPPPYEESFVTPPKETPKSKSEKKRSTVKRLRRTAPLPVNWKSLFPDSSKKKKLFKNSS